MTKKRMVLEHLGLFEVSSLRGISKKTRLTIQDVSLFVWQLLEAGLAAADTEDDSPVYRITDAGRSELNTPPDPTAEDHYGTGRSRR